MQVHHSRPDITDTEIALVNELIHSPVLALEPKMAEFEQAVADYVGRKYAIAVMTPAGCIYWCGGMRSASGMRSSLRRSALRLQQVHALGAGQAGVRGH